jgi:hypothetical protein
MWKCANVQTVWLEERSSGFVAPAGPIYGRKIGAHEAPLYSRRSGLPAPEGPIYDSSGWVCIETQNSEKSREENRIIVCLPFPGSQLVVMYFKKGVMQVWSG